MWQLDHKEGWAPKNWCFWTVVLEKTLGSTLNSKEVKPGNSKGIQPCIFIGRTNAEAPVLWPPDAKCRLIGKDPYARKGWSQRRRKQQRTKWLDSIADSIDMNLNKLWKTVKDRETRHAVVHGVAKHQTWLNNWTTLSNTCKSDGEWEGWGKRKG